MRTENVPSLHVLLAASLLGLVACSDASSPVDPTTGTPVVPISDKKDGVAVRFDTDGTGNCNYDPNPQNVHFGALNTADYAQSAMCGACVAVEGPQGSIVVRIVDVCFACAQDQLALSPQSFSTIAPAAEPQATVNWRYTSCGVEGPVRYRLKDGSSQYWTAIQVLNHRLPIEKLEWLKDGTWVEVKRESYNYFVEPSGMGTPPVQVRITAQGQTLVDTLPYLTDGLIDGAAQFKAD